MKTEFIINAHDTTSILSHFNLNPEEALFFDIETTGFTPRTSTLYMIGSAYYDTAKESYIGIQWFDEDGKQLKTILADFLSFAKDFKAIIHFNGDTFDLPYVKELTKNLELDYTLDSLESIDIYKLIKNYKSALHLENVKQKTVEKFLNISRDDTMSGGELISVYKDYLKMPTDDKKHLLILHNKEDVIGMPAILPILAYPILCKETLIRVTDISSTKEKVSITFATDITLPKRITLANEGITLNIYENEGILNIPVTIDTLKYFYPNYKDYYYLPIEDVAMHKSVATYVDKAYRENAKASNCYTKKEGAYLPQYERIYSEEFKYNYKDKTTYVEVSKFIESDVATQSSYAAHLIRHLFTVA